MAPSLLTALVSKDAFSIRSTAASTLGLMWARPASYTTAEATRSASSGLRIRRARAAASGRSASCLVTADSMAALSLAVRGRAGADTRGMGVLILGALGLRVLDLGALEMGALGLRALACGTVAGISPGVANDAGVPGPVEAHADRRVTAASPYDFSALPRQSAGNMALLSMT